MEQVEQTNQYARKYFASWFRLKQKDQYLIWISDEPDSVMVNEQGYIPVFSSEMALAAYAKSKGIELVNKEPKLHDLDAAEEWLQQPQSSIDCFQFLLAWNLFTDVAHALQVSFIGRKLSPLGYRIYDKLYFGLNHFIGDPVMGHPSGKFYIPQWSLKERNKLAKVLTQGLAIFKSKLLETEA
jgi:hypothetical protein